MYGLNLPPYTLVPLLSPAVTSFPHLTPPPTFLNPLTPRPPPQLSRIHFASAALEQAAIANSHGLFCLSCAFSVAFDPLPFF